MFVKTIEVDEETLHRITIGDVVLTPGQWIKLAWLNQRSRFVGVNPRTGTFYATHEQGRSAFQRCMEGFRRNCRRHTAN